MGDSITVTGNPKNPPAEGSTSPYGFGWELIPQFDSSKIHIYNVALGGRSTRNFIDEGAWTKALDRMQKGDFVTVMFGHNDEANSANYPDRATIMGSGDESVQIGIDRPAKKIHTYGWYLKQYITDAQAKGATIIICSPVPRNQWVNGKIKRGFDGYAQWAKDAALATGVPFMDLNTITADKYDALGQQGTAPYFAGRDTQHPSRAGAKLNAASMITGLKQLGIKPLVDALLPTAGAAMPAPDGTNLAAKLGGTLLTGDQKLVGETEIEVRVPALQH